MVYIPKMWKNHPKQSRVLSISNLYDNPNNEIDNVDNPNSIFHTMPTVPSMPLSGATVEYQKRPANAPNDPNWDITTGTNGGDYTGSDVDAFGKYMKLETEAGADNYVWVQNSDADIVFDKNISFSLNMMVKLIGDDGHYIYDARFGLFSDSPIGSTSQYAIYFDLNSGDTSMTPYIISDGALDYNRNASFDLDSSNRYNKWLELGIRYDAKDKRFYFYFSNLTEVGNQTSLQFSSTSLDALQGQELHLTFLLLSESGATQEVDISNYTLLKSY